MSLSAALCLVAGASSLGGSLCGLPCAARADEVAAPDAPAITLRQQWVRGQKLAYDMTVGGTVTLLDDDESPQPWAGLPMKFNVRGNAAANLETLGVDEAGVGTVVVRPADSHIRAMGLGQVMEMIVKDGFASALINGKAAETNMAHRAVSEPDFALRVSPQGRLEGTVALPKEDASRQAEKKADELPFDFISSLQSWMLQAMPTLWPLGEVKVGDKWTAPLQIPLPPQENKESREPVKAGQVIFTLRGSDEIAGRNLQRVGMEGSFDIDAAAAKTLNQAAQDVAKEAEKNDPKNQAAKAKSATKKSVIQTTRALADAKEKLSGDLWLDSASGQLVRADIKAQGHFHTQGTVTNKAGRTRPTETWADFDGSMQWQLRRVNDEVQK